MRLSYLAAFILFVGLAHSQTIWQTISLEESFSEFVDEFGEFTTVANFLNSTTQFNITLFAPVNSAVTNWTGNATLDIFQYHVHPAGITNGTWDSDYLISTLYNPTTLQESLPIQVTGLQPNQTLNYKVHIINNITCDNGIIYSIDAVLDPPGFLSSSFASPYYPQFATFISFVNSPHLNHSVEIDSALRTVFAPNEAAFAIVDIKLLTYLESFQGKDDLASFLKGHIITNKVLYSGHITDNSSYSTANDGQILLQRDFENKSTIYISNGKSNGTVTTLDIIGANGVGYGIDTFLVPENFVWTVDKLMLGSNASVWRNAIHNANLDYLLTNASGKITIYAPSDAAIAAYGGLPSNRTVLLNMVLYHMSLGVELSTSDFENLHLLNSGLQLPTLNNQTQKIKVSPSNPAYILNGQGNIIEPNLQAANGIVHVIDHVLDIPPNIANFSGERAISLLASMGALELSGVSKNLSETGNFTIFLPDNSGWAQLPDGAFNYLETEEGTSKLVEILQGFVIPNEILYSDVISTENTGYISGNGNQVYIKKINGTIYLNNNACQVLESDLLISNGVIQTIDSVIVPASVNFTVDNLLNGLEYSVLVDAINFVGLDALFNGTDLSEYTLFAPTNEAFETMHKWNSVLASKEELTHLIKAHVVPGSLSSVVKGQTYKTLNSQFSIYAVTADQVRLKQKSGQPVANIRAGSPIVAVDGLIYPIDRVLDVGWTEGDDDDDGLSGGIIALIVILVIFGVLVLVGGGFAFWYFKLRNGGNYQVIN